MWKHYSVGIRIGDSSEKKLTEHWTCPGIFSFSIIANTIAHKNMFIHL